MLVRPSKRRREGPARRADLLLACLVRPLLPSMLLPLLLQEDPHDDFQHLLQGLSGGGEELQQTTDLIWGSSDELGAETRAGSSSSESALQSDSPMVSKVRAWLLLGVWPPAAAAAAASRQWQLRHPLQHARC